MWRIIILSLALSTFASSTQLSLDEIKLEKTKSDTVSKLNSLYEELGSRDDLSDDEVILKRALSHIIRFKNFDEKECESSRSTLQSSYGRSSKSNLPDMVNESISILNKICAY